VGTLKASGEVLEEFMPVLKRFMDTHILPEPDSGVGYLPLVNTLSLKMIGRGTIKVTAA